MPLRNARPIVWRPRGVCDSEDGSNAFPGAMQALINLVPSPTTRDAWVPRPASSEITTFTAQIGGPLTGSALLVVGNIAYGFMGASSGPYAGFDVPFAYDLDTAAFLPISGITAANIPATQPSTGDWTPPILAVVGAKIIFTHPGFGGASNGFFGWLDISSFVSTDLTAITTNGSPILTSVSTDPVAAGVAPGMSIAGANIPVGATVLSMTGPSFDLQTSGNFNAGNTTVTNIADTTGVLAGMEVTGPAVVAGTTVASTGTFSLATTGTTDATDTISSVASTVGVLPGMSIAAADIPAGTLVASVTVSTIVMTQAATGSNSGEALTIDGGNTVVLSVAATSTGTTAVDFTGGSTITISADATGDASDVALTIDGGTAAVPQWASGNTNGFPLPGIPVSVAQFNGRAYYGVGNAVVFSDSENATQVSNTSFEQVVTFNNGLPVTALGGLPLGATSLGGIIQSLIVFQASQMWQITGDPETSNFANNQLGVGIGCVSPLTIAQTPQGLAFVATDGLRIISFFAQLGPPLGASGDGICNPFLNAIWPSRMAGAFNQNVYRVSVQNGAVAGNPLQEYWLHMLAQPVWSGPHTFPARIIAPYQGPKVATPQRGFLMFPYAQPNQLWGSPVVPLASSNFSENGALLQCTWETALLPDNNLMEQNAVVESTLTVKSANNVLVTAYDEQGTLLDQITLGGIAGAALAQQQLAWTEPVVFKQMSIAATVTAAAKLEIGNLYLRYQILGYMIAQASVEAGGPSYLLQENGGMIELESGAGALLLENSA